ncbi:MAG: hypothetical protein ABSH32_25715 [Bryobacteraceae bacterium]|jgi:hypothetical protein
MADLVLRLLVVGGTGLLSVRLYISGLYRRYQAFFYYLIFATLQNIVLLIVNPRSGWYQKIWMITEPIEWIFYILLLLELYSLVLEDHKGIQTMGRWVLYAALAIALLASILGVVPPSGPMPKSRLLPYYYVAERAIYFSLVVFLLSILFFLMRFPVTLNRNTVVHYVVYSVYFLSNTVIFLVLSMVGKSVTHLIGYVLSAVTIGSLAAWLLLLNPAGEKHKVKLRPAWMPADREAELIGQLNSLNAALLRATRK